MVGEDEYRCGGCGEEERETCTCKHEETSVLIRLPKEAADTKLGKTKLLTILKQMGAEVVSEETSLNSDVHAAKDVREVFDYHQSLLSEHFVRGLDLTTDRQRIIRARLRKFSVEELKQCIDVVSKSPFHLALQGSGNDTGKKYLDFSHIMSNDTKVERKLETVAKMSQNANDSDDVKLTLRRIGESLRSGSASLQDQELFQRMVEKLKGMTGETYLWRDDVFDVVK